MKKETEEKINFLLEDGDADEALKCCLNALKDEKLAEDYMFWFTYGKVFWKLGRRPEATSAFRRSLELNPESPAKIALEFNDDISDFFNPDLLNP